MLLIKPVQHGKLLLCRGCLQKIIGRPVLVLEIGQVIAQIHDRAKARVVVGHIQPAEDRRAQGEQGEMRKAGLSFIPQKPYEEQPAKQRGHPAGHRQAKAEPAQERE